MDCPQATAANLFNDGVFRGKGIDVEPWRALVQQFFGENTEAAMAIMACESGGNPNAVNPASRASGLFQFLPSTWKRVTGEEWPGAVFDGPTNIAAAAVLS
ncbi:MAG: transglycosylase SLT domain-containing protein, partial [Gemmatimonadetes bacterium]|nr:transglycosylase SLT domain-containing protein [Gemmatimonadota bacterium]